MCFDFDTRTPIFQYFQSESDSNGFFVSPTTQTGAHVDFDNGSRRRRARATPGRPATPALNRRRCGWTHSDRVNDGHRCDATARAPVHLPPKTHRRALPQRAPASVERALSDVSIETGVKRCYITHTRSRSIRFTCSATIIYY